MSRTTLLLTASWLSLGVLAPRVGHAQAQPTKEQCIAAHADGQAMRKDGKLKSARDRFLVCTNDACPAPLRAECGPWLTEVESALPSVVFEVKGADGKDATAVRVFDGGQLLRDSLDGSAVPLDPGEHSFRFELEGSAPREEKLVLREGDRMRRVAITFASDGGGSDEGGERSAPGGSKTAAFVFAGIGVAGVASFAVFGALGKSQQGELETTCAPGCTDDQVAPVRTKYLIGDISLLAGLVSAGVATYLFLRSPSPEPPAQPVAGRRRPRPPLRFDFAASPSGGYATVKQVF